MNQQQALELADAMEKGIRATQYGKHQFFSRTDEGGVCACALGCVAYELHRRSIDYPPSKTRQILSRWLSLRFGLSQFAKENVRDSLKQFDLFPDHGIAVWQTHIEQANDYPQGEILDPRPRIVEWIRSIAEELPK